VRLAFGLILLLAGCKSIGAISGAAVGIATGTGTTNPLVGYVAAVSTQAAVDELVNYIARKRQQGEQDEIAATVGRLGIGETAPWRIEHDIPIGNEQGEVTVVAAIDNALAECRTVAFTVEPKGTYVTTACSQNGVWKWAQAEPAALRWGFLH
jgi:uncharacterized protein YdbL (DUF1318 family)